MAGGLTKTVIFVSKDNFELPKKYTTGFLYLIATDLSKPKSTGGYTHEITVKRGMTTPSSTINHIK